MTIVHGFELLRQQDIAELRTQARLYRHVKTGAQLLSLVNDDENKCFCITFRTPTDDSTGVPHIMEHSVLCGSRKYPTKEPFTELLKGSLKTFLNAMTYPDKTMYPVASQNVKDFYNLVDVYLDAVFYPLIPPTTLQQEGWHYELENKDDPLIYKGVVFNEMKGVYTAADSILYKSTQQALFPDNTYANDSGGDPRHIPSLTYAGFKGFHDTYYHPSNSYIYFYGDDDPTERLRYLNEWLSAYEPITVQSAIQPQPRFEEPRRVVQVYPIGEDTDASKKSMATVSWMLDAPTDIEFAFGMNVLSYILLASQAAPLRRALIDSGLGEEMAGGGMIDELRQISFGAGLKGVAPADVDKVEPLILDTLKGLVQNGIDRDTVEAAMNTIEFSLRENNTGGYPRGLGLLQWVLSTWIYDGDPIEPLAFETPLNAVKGRLARGERYLEGLIERWLIQNPHRVTVILHPDAELSARQDAEEKAWLADVRASMSDADIERVIAETHHLKALQNTPDSPEALATIPSLKLSDLDRFNKPIPTAVLERQGTRVFYHDLFTNGIAYLDIGFDLHTLTPDLLPYVSLFSRALLEMGTEREDFIKLAQRIGSRTGGIGRQIRSSVVRDTKNGSSWLFLRGKAMRHQTADLLAILQDILLTVRLDNRDRFSQMVLESKARMEQGMIYGGHTVVDSRLSAQDNEADWADEQMTGLTNLFFVRQLIDRVSQDWPSVLAALERIRATLVNRSVMVCNVTLDEANWQSFAPQLDGFLAALPQTPASRADWAYTPRPANEGLVIPGQINYVGKGANLYRHGYTYSGAAAIITRFLNTTWLWDKIRVQGGAYGGFATFDRFAGVFNFLSYRDPNLLSSIENYDKTADFLRHVDLSSDELTKTIIGAIGDLDTYRLPDAKGWIAMERHLFGDNDELRQKMRDEILSATVKDFQRFGEALRAVNEHGHVVVLGGQAAIDKANEARPGWLTVTKVGL